MSIIQYLEDGKTSNQPLSTNLYSELQEDILTGKLKAGEKLTEQKICDEYKVSRTPVREALRQLEMDGLIENIPNRGVGPLKELLKKKSTNWKRLLNSWNSTR